MSPTVYGEFWECPLLSFFLVGSLLGRDLSENAVRLASLVTGPTDSTWSGSHSVSRVLSRSSLGTSCENCECSAVRVCTAGVQVQAPLSSNFSRCSFTHFKSGLPLLLCHRQPLNLFVSSGFVSYVTLK